MTPSRAMTIWLASLILLAGGCRYLNRLQNPPSMVDGPEFVGGALVSKEDATYSAAYTAATQALRDLKIEMIEQDVDNGTISARTTDDKFVRLTITKAGGQSEIRIEIANEPEQARSRLILEQIRKHY